MSHLVTPDQVRELTRNIAANMDEQRITVCIAESEQTEIKPVIGDALFLDMLDNPAKYELPLTGGRYESESGPKSFAGIRTALSYYTYARLVRTANIAITRFGVVEKIGEHSQTVDYKMRLVMHDDAREFADKCMREILLFLDARRKDYPLYESPKGIKPRKLLIYPIGQ